MALSPSHKFGQIIGEMLELAITPILDEVAREHHLYIDHSGPRPARKGTTVGWVDHNGNRHNLDFVFERGGTDDHIGVPVAFIEVAWRRYTKHSRNKAQEIQGAVIPLAETHRSASPFIGAVLAGLFTESSIAQLRSLGFVVLHISYEAIRNAFALAGIDAYFDERTADVDFDVKVATWKAASLARRKEVAKVLIQNSRPGVDEFVNALSRVIARQIDRIRITPLYGSMTEFKSVQDAIVFVNDIGSYNRDMALLKYEIEIVYSNEDRIRGEFSERNAAVDFLDSFRIRVTPSSEGIGAGSAESGS